MTDLAPPLHLTPLHDLHLELGARMVPFAAYAMPVQYPTGVLKEHLHTRALAGLFDVSHMGQLRLSGVGASAALESLVPADIIDLPSGKQRYALFTHTTGGILDDLMVTRLNTPDEIDHLFIVVNAGCKVADVAHLRAHLPDSLTLTELHDHALLALQGPAAVTVLARLNPSVAQLVFMSGMSATLDGASCFVTRSGYTGEDGFEISVPAADASRLARRLLAEPEVAPIGLGARDSLRLEAGLSLYGHDLDISTTPVEASLTWAIAKVRRTDGARAGGFPGAEIILGQLHGGLTRKRVGLAGLEKVPVREGAPILDAAGTQVGTVCSGGVGPSFGRPLALAYVDIACSAVGSTLFAEVRGKKIPMEVVTLPFVPTRYYRG